MKNSYLFLAAIASIALVSCSDEEYVGDFQGSINGESAISFNSEYGRITRATGSDAADSLNNAFVFAGTKTGDVATSTVFDQYNAKYVTNTAGTTESNSNNWEYVSYSPAKTTSLPDGATQSIKYWDYAAKQYDFAAFSVGKNSAVTTDPNAGEIKITSIDLSKKGTANAAYSLEGSVADLMGCYISDLVTAYNRDNVSDYGQPVQFKFRSMATKIRFAFFETVPGYSVKDVQFYNVASGGTASATPTLFTSTACLPAGAGKMEVSFPTAGWTNSPNDGNATDYNKAHVKFTLGDGQTAASTLVLWGAEKGALAHFASKEKFEDDGDYIGRTSDAATYADGIHHTTVSGETTVITYNPAKSYYTILPNEDGANLQLRIKYTLVSTDGSDEEIVVDNATAVVPAELAQWQPNYAYTYIFKISDMTNGSTGEDGDGNIITGLTPITLDAVVVDSEDEDAVQETITTVSEPSITTYSEGKVVTVNNEYVVDAPIYIVVNAPVTSGNTTTLQNITLTVGTNAKLFTATIEDGAAQTISEESVANAIAQNTPGYDDGDVLGNGTSLEGYYTLSGSTYTACAANTTADGTTKYYKKTSEYCVKDANGKKLEVKAADGLTAVSQIDAADSPTGNIIEVPGAKFTPAAAGNYVFQYEKKAAVAAVYYDAAGAKTYNATLDGAIPASTNLTAAQATAYNATVDKAAGDVLTAEEATAYNATLTAITANTDLTTEQAAAYNTAMSPETPKVASNQ